MRWWWIVLVAACDPAGHRPPPALASNAAGSAQRCPAIVATPTQTIRQFATPTAALASMRLPRWDSYKPPDLDTESSVHGGAFFVTIPAGHGRETDEYLGAVHAVFIAASRITVVDTVVTTITGTTPMCGNTTRSTPVAATLVSPHLGHLRVVRTVVDEPINLELPLVSGRDYNCDRCIELFRVEDQLIDLDTGRRRLMLGQTYRAHCYESESPTLIAFDDVVATEAGVEIAGTHCQYSWPR